MGSNHRDHTSGAEQEPLSACLLEGICRLILNLGRVLIHQRILSHAAADHTLKDVLRFGQGR